ncbi:Uncharacterized protein TCM_039798 [Theobroma cacao]|uniref:Uncharacterized protein n=1 Tax=Theobroma cacao TaxID=3641 RepID=A0A061GYK2_THECC|nr:Uncharacterized protein TCM_039798 [Theobroma cacao]
MWQNTANKMHTVWKCYGIYLIFLEFLFLKLKNKRKNKNKKKKLSGERERERGKRGKEEREREKGGGGVVGPRRIGPSALSWPDQ